jgi:hypothetical protein
MMTVGHEEALELTPTSNPYLDFYNDFCKNATSDIDHMFDPTLNAKRRKKLYKSLDVAVAMKYAWAIPDERALRIIKYFGPVSLRIYCIDGLKSLFY